ncbi:MAG: hypothetical protein E7Z69_06645 [Thermoplasmata archaeon]|nr:hypothetical protein [Thermoplasmata archaeon]
MNGKTQILAIAAVAVMVATALVGVGYAYQASYTDSQTGVVTATSDYFDFIEVSNTQNNVNAIPTTATAYDLYAGTSKVAGANDYQWLVTNGEKGTTDAKIYASGTEITQYEIAATTTNVASANLTVTLYYYAGSFKLESPETQASDITLTASTGSTTLPMTLTYAMATKATNSDLATIKDLTYADSGSAKITNQSVTTSGYEFDVFVKATITIAASNMGQSDIAGPVAYIFTVPDVTITLSAAPHSA